MAIGRPTKKRYFSSGEKLLDALKLSGLTWGNNTRLENHVLNNKRWLQFHLPKSANTLVEDIKHGIPQDRLVSYAKFFGVDPRYFVDDAVVPHSKEFECEILQQKYKLMDDLTFPVLETAKKFCDTFHEQNGKMKNSRLFSYLDGVYIVYLKEFRSDLVIKCAVRIYTHDGVFLLADGYLNYHDIDTFLYAVIFKWSTFLHINYYTKNCSVIGYMIAQDPTCSASSLYKTPLTLDVYGIAGSFSSPDIPDRFHGYAEKQRIPEDVRLLDFYHALCKEVSREPSLDKTSRDYKKIFERIQHVQNRDCVP